MATNGIFSGDMTDGNEGVIEEMEAQDDGVRSLPTTEQYECVRHKQVHFRSPGQDVCDTEVHCTFCDGMWRPIQGGFPPECATCTERSRRKSARVTFPSAEDFDALRASVPPAPKYDGPKLYRETNGEPMGPPIWGNPRVRPFTPFNGCAPGSHDDFDPLEHARAVADVANDLRSRGARVSLPRRRRTRVRDRFLRWVFSVAEDALEDLAERFIEAKMRLNVGVEDLDPWPEPVPLRTWDPRDPFAYNEPSVLDDFPELDDEAPFRPLVERPGLRRGVFKGGIAD